MPLIVDSLVVKGEAHSSIWTNETRYSAYIFDEILLGFMIRLHTNGTLQVMPT